jgi:hypothetical protein
MGIYKLNSQPLRDQPKKKYFNTHIGGVVAIACMQQDLPHGLNING